MRRSVGVDIGGTTVRAGIVDEFGTVLSLAALPTPPAGEPAALSEIVARLVAEVGAHATATNSRIGIGIPGVREPHTQVMLRAVNLPRLEGVDVRDLFERRLKCPVALETDVNAAGFAQWRSAASLDTAAHAPLPNRFVYLSLGTGVGGCVILGGHIVRHTRGGPGHLGHLIVDSTRTAPLCRCGMHGCLEAVVRLFTERGTNGELDLAGLVHALTLGLVQLAHLYAPDEIRLGGGVIDHHPHIPELARADLDRIGGTLIPPTLRIERASLPSDRAGVIGAALLANVV
jgi:glucokinase